MLNKNRAKFIAIAFAGITLGIIGSSLKDDDIVQAQSKPKVVASHSVICDLAEAIAEDTIDLTCLIDGDRDPHSYRPTPSQRKAIEEAQLILHGGYQLEPKITDLLQSTDKKIPKIALYEQVVVEPIMAEHEHESEPSRFEVHRAREHDEEVESSQPELAPDPHVWHNVENTVAMVEFLRSLFLQANPSSAELYLTNSTALTEQLWQLDAWIKERIATIPEGQGILVTTHESLNYYVRAYNLEDYITLQSLNADSPTASGVTELAAEIQQAGVPTIFTESTKSDRVIQNVARTADVELSPEKLYVDGIGAADNYIQMMSHNTCAIVKGLEGECEQFESRN